MVAFVFHDSPQPTPQVHRMKFMDSRHMNIASLHPAPHLEKLAFTQTCVQTWEKTTKIKKALEAKGF